MLLVVLLLTLWLALNVGVLAVAVLHAPRQGRRTQAPDPRLARTWTVHTS